MRIGIGLGGSVTWALIAVLGMTAGAQAADRVTTISLGDALENQSGDHHFGVYVPTRFGGELTVQTTDGKVVELKGPNGLERTNGQEIGLDQQGWFTFKIMGAHKPYKVETKFVQVAQSTRKPWNFYYWPTKADSIHEPWAGGNGRVDTDYSMLRGDDELIRSPGSYIPPGEDIVRAGPNGLLETLPPPATMPPGFPTFMMTSPGRAPTRRKAERSRSFRPPVPCSSTIRFSTHRRGGGSRSTVRTRKSPAGPATAWEALSLRSC